MACLGSKVCSKLWCGWPDFVPILWHGFHEKLKDSVALWTAPPFARTHTSKSATNGRLSLQHPAPPRAPRAYSPAMGARGARARRAPGDPPPLFRAARHGCLCCSSGRHRSCRCCHPPGGAGIVMLPAAQSNKERAQPPLFFVRPPSFQSRPMGQKKLKGAVASWPAPPFARTHTSKSATNGLHQEIRGPYKHHDSPVAWISHH